VTVAIESGDDRERRVAMFEDDDDARVEMARSLAESGASQAAAEAFRAIAVDDGVDDTVRLEAARGLVEIDERAAAQACCAIAVDGGVDDTVRHEAARGLAEIG
jgi:HEAT repeat protein